MALKLTTIPKPYRPGFRVIKDAQTDIVRALAQALNTIGTSGKAHEMVSAVERVIGARRDSEDVVATIQSVYQIMEGSDTPTAEMIDAIIAAMKASGDSLLTLSSEEEPDFKKKLEMLMALGNLAIGAKVRHLQQDYERTFYSAKIITDLRPVFADVDETPVGAIIAHTIKIICHEGTEHRELYFRLDDEDLSILKATITRAEAKAKSLQGLLNSAKLPKLPGS